MEKGQSSRFQPFTTQESHITVFINRGNLHVKGVFNIEDGSLTVLKGNIINTQNAPSFRPAEIKRRHDLTQQYTRNINDKLNVISDVKFSSPSGAAVFCIGGSSNGWDEWKDSEGRSLQHYRRK